MLLLLLTAVPAVAQNTVGQISGTISDTSGAVVSGAKVQIANSEINYSRDVTANESRYYLATNLPVGKYSVSVEMTGFKKAVKGTFGLVADGKLTVDFSLEVGAITETIRVKSEVMDTVNTTSGEVARLVDGAQVRDLALNACNYGQITSAAPARIIQFGLRFTF